MENEDGKILAATQLRPYKYTLNWTLHSPSLRLFANTTLWVIRQISRSCYLQGTSMIQLPHGHVHLAQEREWHKFEQEKLFSRLDTWHRILILIDSSFDWQETFFRCSCREVLNIDRQCATSWIILFWQFTILLETDNRAFGSRVNF